ncbi:MAG TPA: MYXO-CTERM sorting domain-containing protein [Polyangiaceae bacterium]|nr:MYXO-CTERM sorting domain-containing protein [Polyangiaceae bacterium]
MKRLLFPAALATVLGTALPAAAISTDFNPSADTSIFADAVDNAAGGALSLWAGGGTAARRTLIRFNVGAIPSGSVIWSTTLWLYMTRVPAPTAPAVPVNETLYAHRLLKAFYEGTDTSTVTPAVAATSFSSTWEWQYNGLTYWTSGGSDVNGTASGSWAENTSLGWQAVTGGGLSTDVSNWVNGSANYGWMLYVWPGSQYTGRQFDSREGATPPILRVVWYKGLGAACGSGAECWSGACPNGYCCSVSSCPGQTECQSTAPTCGPSGSCTNSNYGTGQGCSSDGNPCTVDHCNGSGTCIHTAGNAGASCTDDGNPCTADQCDGSSTSCQHPAGNAGASCSSDGDPCTLDQCNGSSTSCQHPGGNNGASCNDGNLCTQVDSCSGGSCVGGSPKSCPAIDECHTAGSCDPATGICSTPAKADGTGCTDDGNPCTLDQCVGGVCSHPAGNAGAACTDDGNACTSDQCNGSATTCQHPPKGLGTACAADTNPCTLDQCNGAGACTHPAGNAGAQCSPPSCACPGGVCSATLAATCTGASTTCPTAGTVDCQGALCSGNVCAGGCVDDTGCTSGNFCLGGKCTPKRGNGDPLGCSAGNYCSSGNCVDGYCCNTACAGGTSDCQACSVPGKLGICSPVPAGASCRTAAGACDAADTCDGVTTTCTDKKQPANTPCADEGNECTNDTCDGTQNACQHPAKTNGTGCTDDGNPCTTDSCQGGTCSHPAGNPNAQCRASAGVCDVLEKCTGTSAACPTDGFAAGTLSCRAASCTSGVQTLAATCTGSGPACPAVTTKNCAPYVCGATTCKTTCATDNDCSTGNWCNAGVCQPKLVNGTACDVGNSCVSGICTDSVCCNATCSGECEACDVAGKLGQCVPVTGPPHGARTACASDQSLCGGSCNGTLRTACAYPGASTSCRAASCEGGTATLSAACDGAGNCPAVKTVDCDPYVCGATACLGNCNADVDCIPGDYCAAKKCVPKHDPGEACGSAVECKSGFCVDKVCCDSACGDQCAACDVEGKEGTCSPVLGPPHSARPPCGGQVGSTCAGACNGKSTTACEYPGGGVACRDAVCASDVATLGAYCDGAGACPPEQRQACLAFHCNPQGTKCDGNCAVSDDCNFGEFCAGGVCVPSLPNGKACADSTQCASSYCVDGVCCSTPCTGQCESCNESGNEGTCVQVTGAPRGIRKPCASDGTACGGTCDGSDANCTYPGSAKSCRGASCTAGIATLAASCDGAGACPQAQLQSCTPNACSGTKCAGGCAANGDCATGEFCAGGVCIPKLGAGNFCGADAQCGTGHCVDGFCCDTTCDGQCQACDIVGKVGKCTTVPAGYAPHGGRVPCPGAGTCGATCDGKNPLTCAYPGGTTSCGLGLCKDGVAQAPSVCNGAGSCLPSAAVACAPYVCSDDGTAAICRTDCGTSADCVPGYACVENFCVPTVPDAGSGGVDSGTDSGAVGGAPGTGGKTGAGGTRADAGTAAGGAPNAGGASGASGSESAGGSSNRPDAGTQPGGDAGPNGNIGAKDTGACGCRLADESRSSGSPLAVLALAALLATRRRRKPAGAERV